MHGRQPGQQLVLRAKRDALRVHGLLQHLDQRVEVRLADIEIGVRRLHVRALVDAGAAHHHAELLDQPFLDLRGFTGLKWGPVCGSHWFRTDKVSQTKYARLGTSNNPILGMRLNQSGLDFALSSVVNILNGLDLNSMIGGSKIYDTTWKLPVG